QARKKGEIIVITSTLDGLFMYADQVHAKTPKSWSWRIYRVAKDERQHFTVPFVSYALYYAPIIDRFIIRYQTMLFREFDDVLDSGRIRFLLNSGRSESHSLLSLTLAIGRLFEITLPPECGYIFLRIGEGILPNTYCDRITQRWGGKGGGDARMTRPHSSINAVAIRLYSFVNKSRRFKKWVADILPKSHLVHVLFAVPTYRGRV
ncbi:hypothetical protein P3W45_001869, partial [Vairimorpha bombi]